MATQSREAKLILVPGRKGEGKTYQTLLTAKNYLNTTLKRVGRKVLFFDINNEYGNVREDHNNPNFPSIGLIKLRQVPAFSKLNEPIAKRVSVFKDTGGKMNLAEMRQALSFILQYYRNGLLVLEDINKYLTDSLPGDLIGSICTLRHVSVDVIIHLQTVGRLFNPKLWGNCNEVRLHRTDDTIKRHESKVDGNLEHLFIMEKLIELKIKKGDKRFFCYLDKDANKIRGRFTKAEFIQAIEAYLSSNYNAILKPLLNERQIYTGNKKYQNQKQAVQAYIIRLMREYL